MVASAHGAHVGLVLLSPEFAGRKWPMRELQIFWERGTLVPALVPPLTYEQAEKALRASELVPAEVTVGTLRTTMLTGTAGELERWKDGVLLAVVRALVHHVVKLPNRTWVGMLCTRTIAAAESVAKLPLLTKHETDKLTAEVANLESTLRVGPRGTALVTG
jgi:hypothetical protein